MREWETLNVRSVRYDVIQERARSVMPRDERVCNRREWSTVSTAEDRSRRRRTEYCFLVLAVSRSLVTLVRAVSVEWWGRKPDCRRSKREQEER